MVDGLAQLAAAVRGMHASEARLRAVFACSPIGMALLDADGRVVETNAALARFLGRDEDALAGSRLGELAHADETEPFAAGRLERRFVHADGQVVWAATSIVDLPDDDGVGGMRLICVDDVTTRRRTERLLLHAALHDSLTNLPNRRLLRDRLDTALARAGRSANTVAVLFIDLDDFKHVNDSMGHEVGDELLVAVARNIASVLRTCDTVARLGGDEFVVVCEDVAGEGDISRLARRVLDAIRRPVQLRGRCVSTTASIGVAVPSAAGESTDELIRLADLAMYRAKRQGDGPDRADFVLADDSLRSLAAPGTELAAELRHAIQADQLRLHYQPVVTWSGRLLGLEALLRWPHPSRGLLLPSEFLHAAEGTDLAQPLSDWVLRTAIVDAASWQAAGLRVSVNMWAGEIARSGFAENVAALLTWAGLPARSLYLEVHEHDLADAGPALADELAQLRRLGVGLAVDAFGSGGASLADLKRLPGDTVKIDRAFVAAVCDDPADAAIVRAIADTARATGRHPVAAGVETAAQLHRLRELGCTTVQGYLTGRPTPLVDLREVIRDRRVRLP